MHRSWDSALTVINYTSLCAHSYPEGKEKAPMYFFCKFDDTTNFMADEFLFGNSQTF